MWPDALKRSNQYWNTSSVLRSFSESPDFALRPPALLTPLAPGNAPAVISESHLIRPHEIDPPLNRHKVHDGPVLRRERLDIFSAVVVPQGAARRLGPR